MMEEDVIAEKKWRTKMNHQIKLWSIPSFATCKLDDFLHKAGRDADRKRRSSFSCSASAWLRWRVLTTDALLVFVPTAGCYWSWRPE